MKAYAATANEAKQYFLGAEHLQELARQWNELGHEHSSYYSAHFYALARYKMGLREADYDWESAQ